MSAKDSDLVEARPAPLPWIRGALALRGWAYAAALLAAFVVAYALAASGSDRTSPSGDSRVLPGSVTHAVRPAGGARDVVPLPRLAPAQAGESPAEVSR